MKDVEREALIEVVSEHPRWTEEDQCNLCPGDEPYEQHIAPFLDAIAADATASGDVPQEQEGGW